MPFLAHPVQKIISGIPRFSEFQNLKSCLEDGFTHGVSASNIFLINLKEPQEKGVLLLEVYFVIIIGQIDTHPESLLNNPCTSGFSCVRRHNSMNDVTQILIHVWKECSVNRAEALAKRKARFPFPLSFTFTQFYVTQFLILVWKE